MKCEKSEQVGALTGTKRYRGHFPSKLHERQGGLQRRVAGGLACRKPPGFWADLVRRRSGQTPIWTDANLDIGVTRNNQRVMKVHPRCRGGHSPSRLILEVKGVRCEILQGITQRKRLGWGWLRARAFRISNVRTEPGRLNTMRRVWVSETLLPSQYDPRLTTAPWCVWT